MNIPKTAKLGLACAAALSYSVIPTYLLKYRWIFRSRQRASREEKVLYLTFDDGPDTVYTNILLDFLEKEQIPAAFFMVAGSARKHPGIVERMRKSGYQVGIHSLSHESAMLSGPGRTGRGGLPVRHAAGGCGLLHAPDRRAMSGCFFPRHAVQ